MGVSKVSAASSKKKRGLVFFLIGVALCLVAFFFWWFNSRIPIKAESVSPDGTYLIRVGWNETQIWPHHAPPIDIELHGYQTGPKKKLFTLQSTIDNDKGNAWMDEDIWIFWESDSCASILLLGRYQTPEVITVDFKEGSVHTPEITRERSYSVAQNLFLEHHIPLSALAGIQ